MIPEDKDKLEKDGKLNILNYWLDIESHSPPNIKTSNFVNKSDSKWNQSIFFKRKDEILWKEPLAKEIDDPKNWVHKVFLGVFNTKYVIFEFSTKEKEDLEEMKQFHNTCLVSFMVDGEGYPIKNTLRVPDYLKSIALNTIADKEKAIDFELKLQDTFATWIHRLKNQEEQVGYTDLMFLLENILNELNWTELQNAFKNKDFYSLAYTESLKLKDAQKIKFDTDDITSSMIYDDLEKVTKAVSFDQTSEPLDRYLNEEFNSTKKIDVVNKKNKDMVRKSLHIDNMPPACWPFNGGYPLVSSQQYAVNKIFKEIDDYSVLSVNGAPGTGKTTLLKDIVANIIYERAKKLISFKDDPTSAFTKIGETSLKINTKQIQEIFKLDNRLCGFEIVVASSNNGAVENITKELPLIDEIDESWKEDLSYMSKLATQVNDKESWGMISASLGNKNNNYNFFSNFLFNQKGQHSIFDFLNKPNFFIEKRISWEDACSEFEHKERKVSKIKSQLKFRLEKVEKIESDKLAFHKRTEENKFEVRNYKMLHAKMKDEKADIDTLHSAIRLKTEKYKKLRADIKGGKIGLFASKAKMIEECKELRKVLEVQKEDYRNKSAKFSQRRVGLQKFAKKIKKEEASLKTLKSDLVETMKIMEVGKPIQSVPNDDFWDQNFEKIQISSPWHTKELNKARVELFVASMNLHKAFIAENKESVKSNLEVFRKVLNKDFNESNEYLTAVWQTLFLVVPVISTTFSSFGTLFAGLRQEALGWLLIDEAGQATPQAPVGALWRSKRALFVGDPLQVQPVVQIEDKLSNVLLEKNSVSLNWSSTMLSAQELADRVNPFGTEIDLGDKKWVGMPLRVHRRCDNPMFAISNKIAYNDLMIFGKKRRVVDIDIEKQIGKTSWFNVEGEPQGASHWIPEEGEKVIQLLSKITNSPTYEQPNELPKIYIISPFKNVSYDLKRVLKQSRKEWVPNEVSDKELQRWLDSSVGTIHSFQGGETEVVFLVLGGNKARAGAINWVCDEPNILNVATTRAQKAFYIIGNKEIWNSGVFGLIKEFIK